MPVLSCWLVCNVDWIGEVSRVSYKINIVIIWSAVRAMSARHLLPWKWDSMRNLHCGDILGGAGSVIVHEV